METSISTTKQRKARRQPTNEYTVIREYGCGDIDAKRLSKALLRLVDTAQITKK